MNRRLRTSLLASVIVVSMVLVIYGERIAPFRAIGAILLVLILPGYAITDAAFDRAWGVPERVMFTLGISLGLAVVSGLALNWTRWGLQPASWTLFLGGIALVATLVGSLRRERQPAPRLVRPAWRSITLGAAAGVFVVAAYGLAAYGATQRPAAAFTQLWMLPRPDDPRAVEIGIRNEEGMAIRYRLVLRAGVDVVQEWPQITLQTGEEWQTVVALSPEATTEDLVASLYRQDQPNTVYRYVTLRSQG